MVIYEICTVDISSDTNQHVEYYVWTSQGISSHNQYIRANELTSYTNLDVLLAIF